MSAIIHSQDLSDTFTFKVNDLDISLLNEVQRRGNASILIGATSEMLEKTIPQGNYPSAVNAFLIKTKDKNILVDTGYGTKLFDNLATLGVSPAQIDVVLLTHMHGDHIGGLFKDEKIAFPNAKIYVSELEHQYWVSDASKNNPAQKVFDRYKDQMVFFDPVDLNEEQCLLPHIKAVKAYGHTPGHTMFLIESGKSKLLIWGDLTHALDVQIAYPEVAVTYDIDPKQAIETRVATLKYVMEHNIPIVGMHVPSYSGKVKITRGEDGGYIFVPLHLRPN